MSISDMMTLEEVCAYFRVNRRVLVRFGLERLGGVRLGPRSWRFHRSHIVRYGLSQSEPEQGQVSLDGAAFSEWKEATEMLFDEKGSSSLGDGRRSRCRDVYDLLD